MRFHKHEKFHRGHLKGNGDVLVSVHHDHIVLLVHRIQECPAVIGGHRHVLRQMEVFPGQRRDFFINLHALDIHIAVVFPALGGIGAGPHAKYQHLTVLRGLLCHHQRGGHGIIIIHARKPLFLHIDGLDAKEHIGG